MLSEFDIIERFFHQPSYFSKNVVMGVGDDAALFEVPRGFQLVTTIDSLVENIHFPPATKAYDLGYKSLAVSLSDIAAMGATPCSTLLALTLPQVDEAWLQDYAGGFFSLAKQHQVDLIGGNITRGPLCMNVVVNGLIPSGEALLRSGAKVGDLIYVTGTLGDASLALELIQTQVPAIDEFLLKRFFRPTPRLSMGVALRGIAHAAIDISDGLSADLEKILVASRVGACIYADRLPLSALMRHAVDEKRAWEFALSGGEDYELCFTIPPEKQSDLKNIIAGLDCETHCIGNIIETPGLTIFDRQENPMNLKKRGYEHFTN